MHLSPNSYFPSFSCSPPTPTTFSHAPICSYRNYYQPHLVSNDKRPTDFKEPYCLRTGWIRMDAGTHADWLPIVQKDELGREDRGFAIYLDMDDFLQQH